MTAKQRARRMIPAFEPSGVLPPFLGARPGRSPDHAPYRTSSLEIVNQLGTSLERLTILEGFLDYRRRLGDLGIVRGFQWIDGSFVEDCEMRRGRPPKDMDLVTFFRRPDAVRDDVAWGAFIASHTEALDDLFIPDRAKALCQCDGYPVELDTDVEAVVAQTHFWFGLFSHSREDREWKGILQVELHDPQSDAAAALLIADRRAQWSAS